ncbi:melanopsin-like [Pocillopora verrucosa]|uniref:melanopsin-like n=1 Tax=Pocillopora verrucosa TaxID=203993 RepID=UPI00333EFFEF
MDNITTKDTHSLPGGKSFNWRAMYLAYAVVMFAVVTVGFLGNVLTLIILHYREHRKKVLTPLMINLAVGDILMVIVVYPVVIASNLVGKQLKEGSLRCKWSAFANGAIGITTIATLVVMSGVMYHGIKQTLPKPKIHAKNMSLLVLSTWLYGILLNLPPVIGWTRAVPGEAGISCAPEWTSSEPESVAYIAFLLVFGFFLPLTVIGTFHYMIYRVIRRVPLEGNPMIRACRMKSKMRLVRMTSFSIAAFVVSWLPYCVVSIAALVNGHHVLSSGEAEIPELMAKASVIYNPFVYAFTNGTYRASLKGLLIGGYSVIRVNPSVLRTSPAPSSYVNSVIINPQQEDTAL